MLISIISVFTSVSFLYYGVTCLFSKEMVLEFERFGVSPMQRVLTGIFQLLGSVGLLFGLFIPLAGIMAAGGLAVLMLLGFLVRLKIKDSIAQSLPAFFFMLLNAYLSLLFYQEF
ncbi:MAG: DoxX family protein [Cytophagales bacterium]|nr:DoxX family protein [Cytophagales bacterium]